MTRFIDTKTWSGGKWEPIILNAATISDVTLADEHAGRPACVLATFAATNGERWIYLDMDWKTACAAFAAVSA